MTDNLELTIHEGGFRYVPVDQFTPLKNDGDWYGITDFQSFVIQPNTWQAQIKADAKPRKDQSSVSQGYLWIELVSYTRNIFRDCLTSDWISSGRI